MRIPRSELQTNLTNILWIRQQDASSDARPRSADMAAWMTTARHVQRIMSQRDYLIKWVTFLQLLRSQCCREYQGPLHKRLRRRPRRRAQPSNMVPGAAWFNPLALKGLASSTCLLHISMKPSLHRDPVRASSRAAREDADGQPL